MESNQPVLTIFERLNRWIEESITVKLFSIGFLVLVLLVPSAWIANLMEERQVRADGAMDEVYQKWSGSQSLSGPILVIPYTVTEKVDLGTKVEMRERTEKYYFLSQKLSINGKVEPKILHRGIYDAAVYNSSMQIEASFAKPDFKTLGVDPSRVHWNDAYMVFSISDMRGISENPVFKIGQQVKETEPSNNLGVLTSTKTVITNQYPDPAYSVDNTSSQGILAKMNWTSEDDFDGTTSITLNLKGSRSLNFLPTGKTTLVSLQGPWSDPSFDGDFLPEEREITKEGFSASWKVLHFNRPFSQQWTNNDQLISGADFGVNLLIPVDQYQKSIRTAKYGQLIIILTFLSLFLVEITRRIRIHPFQYILVGAALIIYYTLLLSFSEQVGYNAAYIVATAATILLVSFYAKSFLKEWRLTILLSSLLTVFYSFIFIIILQQDFSLLLGSIGLFMIVAALMYVSRKIEWYKSSVTSR